MRQIISTFLSDARRWLCSSTGQGHRWKYASEGWWDCRRCDVSMSPMKRGSADLGPLQGSLNALASIYRGASVSGERPGTHTHTWFLPPQTGLRPHVTVIAGGNDG